MKKLLAPFALAAGLLGLLAPLTASAQDCSAFERCADANCTEDDYACVADCVSELPADAQPLATAILTCISDTCATAPDVDACLETNCGDDLLAYLNYCYPQCDPATDEACSCGLDNVYDCNAGEPGCACYDNNGDTCTPDGTGADGCDCYLETCDPATNDRCTCESSLGEACDPATSDDCYCGLDESCDPAVDGDACTCYQEPVECDPTVDEACACFDFDDQSCDPATADDCYCYQEVGTNNDASNNGAATNNGDVSNNGAANNDAANNGAANNGAANEGGGGGGSNDSSCSVNTSTPASPLGALAALALGLALVALRRQR